MKLSVCVHNTHCSGWDFLTYTESKVEFLGTPVAWMFLPTALANLLNIFVLHAGGNVPRVTFSQRGALDGSDWEKSEWVVVQVPLAASPTP